MKATQAGPAGAIRKLKFSPGSRVDSELLAFTEVRIHSTTLDLPTLTLIPSQHRSKVHVVDARTFDQMQLLDVPSSTSNVPCPPPRPRPPPSHGITPRAFVDSVYAESGSPEERFMRRLLHDVGSTTQERSRSRGERGWRYVGGEPSSAMDDGWEEDDESEEEEDEEEREEQGRPPIAAGGRRSRLAEDDCPPDSVGADGTSTSISGTLSLANYARILPDPRARPIPPFTASNPRPPPIPGMTTSMILALRSGNRLPTSSLNPTGGGAQVLSGYTPLAAYGLDPTSDWRRELGLGAGVAYEPNSLYFPIESTPSDLLGLDWDEEGTSLFVATEGRVWEWEVDTRARRSFGDWGLR